MYKSIFIVNHTLLTIQMNIKTGITFLFIRITMENKGINAIYFMQPEMSIHWVCEIHCDINTKSLEQ